MKTSILWRRSFTRFASPSLILKRIQQNRISVDNTPLVMKSKNTYPSKCGSCSCMGARNSGRRGNSPKKTKSSSSSLFNPFRNKKQQTRFQNGNPPTIEVNKKNLPPSAGVGAIYIMPIHLTTSSNS